ncbi:hypothetical protein AAC387_Pa01g0106 [Persea americana]
MTFKKAKLSFCGGGEGSDAGISSYLQVKQELKHGRPELFPMGSGLPDCSHACGPCFPCKRVIVGVKCFVSESCPVVYRCMCKGKYYPVPSN